MWSQNRPVREVKIPSTRVKRLQRALTLAKWRQQQFPPPPPGSTRVEYRTQWMTSSAGNSHTKSHRVRSCSGFLPVHVRGFSCCRGSSLGFLETVGMPKVANSSAWSFYSPGFWRSGRGLFIFHASATRGRGRRSSPGWVTQDLFLAPGDRNSANATYFLGLCANFLFGCSPSHHP